MQDQIQNILNEAVASGQEHGVQCVVWRDGKKIVDACAGTRLPDGKPVTPDTLFPVFSAGKGIVSTSLHRLVELGKCSYDQLYSTVWPEFGSDGRETITLEYVMSHRSGMHLMPRTDTPEELADWNRMSSHLAAMKPAFEPGSQTAYQAITYSWMAGEFAARVAGCSFQEWIRKSVLEPVGIENDVYFGVDDEADDRVSLLARGQGEAPVEITAETPFYIPLERMMTYPEIRKCCLPGAGALASANGLAKHYQALLDGFLSADTLKRATTLNIPPGTELDLNPGSWAVFGLGYGLLGPRNDLGSVFGHNGYGGSTGFADMNTRTAFALAKTDIHMGDDPTRRKICNLLGIDYKNW